MSASLLPGADGQQAPITLGVLGGGQLGRMFVHAAQTLGFATVVLDPDPVSPAGLASTYHIATDYLDEAGLAQFMQRANAITLEFENVPAAAVHTLQSHRPTAPDAQALAIAQDRAAEKAYFASCGVPCAPYACIADVAALAAVSVDLFPAILKTARLGYDGKGQVSVESAADLPSAWAELGRVPCVLEQRLPLAMECSVIVARNAQGQWVHLPVQRNEHRLGILAVTHVYPGAVPDGLVQELVQAAARIAERLSYVGVLCVEFFVLPDGRWVVNEMAPRPHNSGHYSIDACDVSQFDLQVRCMANLPLTAPRQHSPALMLNLLGDLWWPAHSTAQGSSRTPPWDQVLALPGAHLHLYGKPQARPGRKMGHLTLTADSSAEVLAHARAAASILGLPEPALATAPALPAFSPQP